MAQKKTESYRGNSDIKGPGVQIEWTPEMVEEYIKCRDDVFYFIEKYFKIVTEDGMVPIKLRWYQKEFIKSMHENRFTIMVTGRQMGKTEALRAYVIHYILFNEFKTVAILANKQETGVEILSKIQLSYQNIPLWLQQGVKGGWNARSVKLENGSRVITAATSPSGLRGYTAHLLIIDEAAHIDDYKEDAFFSAMEPTISAGKKTKLVLVSTPNGISNYFAQKWKGAIEKTNDYHAIKAIWSDVPGRGPEWKERELANMNFNREKFAQEYEGQFLGSSGTLIAGWKLELLKPTFPVHDSSGIRMYEAPVPGKAYVGAVDVSRAKGRDYSTLQMIDVSQLPYKQVLTYRSNEIPPTEFAQILNGIGLQYNTAALLVEINDIGEQTADLLWLEYEYPNILFTEANGRQGLKITHTYTHKKTNRGIRTTKPVKAAGCAILKILIEQDQLLIQDKHTIEEFYTFSLKTDEQSYAAEKGNHDDMVMPLVLFSWLSATPYFRDLTDINTLLKLREHAEEDVLASLVPFGFWNDGIPNEEDHHVVSKADNVVWKIIRNDPFN